MLLSPAFLQPGDEQHEHFFSHPRKRNMVHDYRDHDKELFTCIAHTLIEARDRRNLWLAKKAGRMVQHAC